MKVTSDISTKQWHYEEEELPSRFVEIFFAFRDNGQQSVKFNNLSFGYQLLLDGDKVSEELKPEAGVTYLSTDQDYIESFTINQLSPDKEYVLNVWSENDGELWQDSFNFVLPIPPAPFASWTWNSEESEWEPPIPYPEDEDSLAVYDWDEENQQWVPVSE